MVLPTSLRIHDPREVATLIEAVRLQAGDDAIDLVVVDTLTRNFVGGSLNSDQDMGRSWTAANDPPTTLRGGARHHALAQGQARR